MNIPPEYLSLLTIILSGLVTLLVNKWAQKNVAARIPFQNDKDKIDALKAAFDLVGMDFNEQLAMKKELKELREIVSNTQIQITTVSTVSLDGENPSAQIVKIESVRVIKQQEPSPV